MPGPAPTLRTLRKRHEFLAAARGQKAVRRGLILQGRKRDDAPLIGVGFTCSKKVGNAVARNRAKRRLRAVAGALIPSLGTPGWDYVLIGLRDRTASRPFEALKADLAEALQAIHSARR